MASAIESKRLTCVVVNLISAGYILLPHAFAQAGVLLSSFVLFFVVWQTYISGNFLLVAGSHAEALNNHKSLGGTLPPNYAFALEDRKYEMSHLYGLFMSKIEATFFTATTIGDLYGLTWALISIFSTTLSEWVPFGEGIDSYKLYLVVFVSIAIPLSCTAIVAQLWVQLVFLALRMVMVTLMTITIVAAMGQNAFGDYRGPAHSTQIANFGNLVPIVMTSVFSTAYQFSVPCMAASSEDTKNIAQVFQKATTFVFVTNLLVAVSISFYFGPDHTAASSNILWSSYHGGDMDDTPTWASAISWYVTLFAAIDGVAVYPLVVIALGDIIMGSIYGDNVHEAEKCWKTRLCFRLLGSCPQAFLAIFVRELDVIATYAGICTLLSYTTAPALLMLYSRRRMIDENITPDTHYSTPLSSPVVAVFLVILSVGIIPAIFVDALM